MTATMLKKLLPYSRNVFAVVLLGFVFRMIPALLAVTIVWGMESVLGSGVHHDPWDDMRRELRFFATMAALVDPIVLPIAGVITYFKALTTEPHHVYAPVRFVTLLVAPIPLCWFACCLVNRRVIFNLPQKSFWFFAFIQQYFLIGLLFGLIISSVLDGRLLAAFSMDIFPFFFLVIFPLICWWGVERLRKKHVPETDT